MKFRFKKTWRGMVLYVEDRTPKGDTYMGPSSWKYYWRKATEKEAIQFEHETMEMAVYKKVVNELKEAHPELLI